MIPGRELDALIAEKVFGCSSSDLYINEENSHFSTDIAAAWSVVQKLIDDSWKVTLISSEFGGTDCLLECGVGARGRFSSDTMEGLETTAPHAICLAAIKAMGVKA